MTSGPSYNNTITQLPVWAVDDNGNSTQAGRVTSGDGVALTATTNPAPPTPGDLLLTTPDGTNLNLVGATGVTPALNLNTLALTGATTATLVETVKVTGDANPRWQISAAGVQMWGNGTGATDTNLYRGFAGAVQTDSVFVTANTAAKAIQTSVAGGGLAIKEGTNARMGTVALVAGAATVANTSVTATSRIYLTSQVDGGTPGFLRVSTRTAGTSFTITSSSGTDTSTVAYLMVEPS